MAAAAAAAAAAGEGREGRMWEPPGEGGEVVKAAGGRGDQP
jgi:hypothetical protein